MIKNSAQFLQVLVYYTHKNMYLMSTNLAASYNISPPPLPLPFSPIRLNLNNICLNYILVDYVANFLSKFEV